MAVSFEKVMNGQDSHNEGAIWENESFQQWGKFEKKKKKKHQAQPLLRNLIIPIIHSKYFSDSD